MNMQRYEWRGRMLSRPEIAREAGVDREKLKYWMLKGMDAEAAIEAIHRTDRWREKMLLRIYGKTVSRKAYERTHGLSLGSISRICDRFRGAVTAEDVAQRLAMYVAQGCSKVEASQRVADECAAAHAAHDKKNAAPPEAVPPESEDERRAVDVFNRVMGNCGEEAACQWRRRKVGAHRWRFYGSEFRWDVRLDTNEVICHSKGAVFGAWNVRGEQIISRWVDGFEGSEAGRWRRLFGTGT